MPVSSLLCRVSASLLALGNVSQATTPTVRIHAPSLDSSAAKRFQASSGGLAERVAAHEHDPQDRSAIRDLEAAVESGLPDQIAAAWLPSLPVDSSTLPNNLGTQVVPKEYLPTPATEPQHGWSFSRITYLYITGGTAGTDRLLCRLHYTQTSDAALAARAGGLLALAHRTLTQRTGRAAANGSEPFDVWLCRKGQSGGEQWRSNLYFYDLDTPRSSIEWIREIAHEYGHLALPAIGGYSAPEYWANGYYGERLITRWIARVPGGPALVAQVWGDFSGWPNFQRLLITPAIALYKKTGPSTKQASRTDETGMRYLIGQILTFDDKYGAARLGEVFSRLPRFHEVKAADFEEAIAETLPRGMRQARRHS